MLRRIVDTLSILLTSLTVLTRVFLSVPAAAFDWDITAVAADDTTLEPAQSFSISATVENVGATAAADTTLTFYCSEDALISNTADTELVCASATPAKPRRQ